MRRPRKLSLIPLVFFPVLLEAQALESWTLLAPTGPLPGPRDFVDAVYSSASNRLIAFGGYPHTSSETNDLWILQNANGVGTPAWTLAIPSGTSGSPQPRLGSAMVYDAHNNRAMLVGGLSLFNELLNDVWVLMNADGTTGTPSWIQLSPTGALPGRVNHLVGYDPSSNRLIVTMGSRNGFCDPTPCVTDPVDVWILTNANGLGGTPTWAQLATTGMPPGRLSITNGPNPCYDPVGNRFIVFGGLAYNEGKSLNDVWVLSNANGLGGSSAWTQISPSGALPPPRDGAAGFYDAGSNRLGIFGGQNQSTGIDYNDFWLLDNANGIGGAPAWSQISPGGTPISPRFGSSGVYDSVRNRMIVFGGSVQGFVANETWVLSNANGIVGSNLAVQYISPSNGGNTGSVTVQIVGSTFQDGVTVMLSGSGVDILGTNTTLSSPSTLATTFNLAGVAPGLRSVVITNPDNTSVSLASAFNVEEGGAQQLQISVIGSNRIRTGYPREYYIAFTNQGNLDSSPALASLAFPQGVLASTDTNNTSTFTGGSTSNGDDSVLLTGVSAIPAGGAIILPVTMTLPTGSGISSFALSVYWNSSDGAPDTSTFDFDQYATFQGYPFVPYNATCSSSLSEYNDELQSHTAALLAYLNLQNLSAVKTTDETTLVFLAGIMVAKLAAAASLVTSEVALSAEPTAGIVEAALHPAIDTGLDKLKAFLPDQSDSSYFAPWQSQLESAVDSIGPLETVINASYRGLAAILLPTLNAVNTAYQDVAPWMSVTSSYWAARSMEQSANDTFTNAFGAYISKELSYKLLAAYCGGSPSNPPPPTPGPSASITVTGAQSFDPNAKIGPTGVGSSMYVSAIAPLGYTIEFDNQATATAPAQAVTVTDTLDPHLDPNTLALGPITFANQVVNPPSIPLSILPFAATVDLRPTTNVVVYVTAYLSISTGTLTEQFQSLDPATGLPPADPTAGFLPPGAEGSIFFTAMPKSTLTGTSIQNTATVVFDANAPINTPTWSNTVDSTPPVSKVAALSSRTMTYSFPVQWSGLDVGSGIRDYTVDVSDNGGPYLAWMTNTSATQAIYAGANGHSYAFYSIARDFVGNVENAKTSAEATTTLNVADACNTGPDATVDVAAVQMIINQALGATSPLDDLNGDGVVNVTDVQIVINAALGLGCSASQPNDNGIIR